MENIVQQNSAKAVEWYRKAAEQEYAPAQYNLGSSYFYGEGVKKDRNEARYWMTLSANQGYQTAKDFLEKHF